MNRTNGYLFSLVIYALLISGCSKSSVSTQVDLTPSTQDTEELETVKPFTSEQFNSGSLNPVPFNSVPFNYGKETYQLAPSPNGSLVITQSAWHSQNAGILANPASLMKLLTASVAAKELGPDYRFNTHVVYDRKSLKKGVLRSPARLIMQGDPTFTRADLKDLLWQLKKSGVKKVTDLDIDISRYSGHQWGIGQEWNDHGVCFAAPVSAAIINGNCVYASITTAKVGAKTHLYLSPHSHLNIDNQVITVAEQEATDCQFLLKVIDNNDYRLTGCLSNKNKRISLGFSVNEPNLFLAKIVQRQLSLLDLGDKVNIRIIESPDNIDIKAKKYKVFTHQSKAIRELIVRMLQHSNNLIADALFKESGYQYSSTEQGHNSTPTGSYLSGKNAVFAMLQSLHINTDDLVIRDGSGLSRGNLIYADTLYQLLIAWQINPDYHWLIDELAVSGESGTLKERETFADSNLKGQVLAKTGSMNGVRNLAGYVKLDETLMPFVLMVNQFSTPAQEDEELTQQEVLLYEFERAFLQIPFANY